MMGESAPPRDDTKLREVSDTADIFFTLQGFKKCQGKKKKV